jgi:CheY-like chemotaxis protein
MELVPIIFPGNIVSKYYCLKNEDSLLRVHLFSTILKKLQKKKSQDETLLVIATIAALNSLNILLADDDADDRELFKEAISEINSKIVFRAVEDGIQLMDELSNDNLPDIIFLDLNMPGKSGRECLQDIRKNKKLSGIPVIIYSTSSNPKDINETYSIGANLYMQKPNTFKELLALTKRVFSLNWNEQKPHSLKKDYFLSQGKI